MADDWHTPTAINSACDETDSANLIDDNTDTMWTHYVSEAHWVIFDMGETYTVKKIQIYDKDGWGLPLDITAIYVTDDIGTLGDSVGSYAFPDEAGGVYRDIDTTDKDGRYIKLVSEVAEMSRWYEFDIYGSTTGAPPSDVSFMTTNRGFWGS